jgi:DNA repair protein RadA/Sms
MPAPTAIHVCSACGHETARWAGQCPGCGEWNTLLEETRATPVRGAARRRRTVAQPVELGAIRPEREQRLSTGIGELDSVLGGGIVPGSLVLIGGAPGIGKSTLTTMALANLVEAGRRTLYISAEESPRRSASAPSGSLSPRLWRSR